MFVTFILETTGNVMWIKLRVLVVRNYIKTSLRLYLLPVRWLQAVWLFLQGINLLFLQFDLVCNRGYLGFVSTSVIFAGFIAGSVSVSTISDKFGRKLPLFVCGFFCCLFNFVSAFAPAFWVFALFRAIVGFMIGKIRS